MELNKTATAEGPAEATLDVQTDPAPRAPQPPPAKVYMKNGRTSYFDGGLLQFVGWSILGAIITLGSAGLLYPWALTMVYGWKINHTVIEGKRLRFTGSAIGLFGNWIKWWFLTFITFSIYGFWVFIKLEDWKAKHTSFAN